MTTIEKNTLIAEFMGLSIITDGISHFDTQYRALKKYESSWGDIIPVVEKIESIIFPGDEYFNFNILGGCYVIIVSSNGDELVTSDRGQSKLECTYDAVVEFIQWYNQQPK